MQTEDMIPAEEFCVHHNIELSFIYSLKEIGLLETSGAGEKILVPAAELSKLEKLSRLYYEMDINLEGIETITWLLHRMDEMQQQMLRLSNRLSQYENG
jgi:chaperone modulatory protein CbpM